MKKALGVSIVTFLMWMVIGTSAQASIIAGTYRTETGYPNFDGVFNGQSLLGGEFGLHDLASGHSSGDYWSYTNLERTLRDRGPWSADLSNPDNLSAWCTEHSKRSNGTILVSGAIFGESPASTYMGSVLSESFSTIYISRTNSSSPWIVENYSGKVTFSGSFSSEPFSFTLTADQNFNENYFQMKDGYRYIVDAPLSNVVLTITENPVPEPATMLLFGLGLLGIAGASRRKK